MYWLPPTVGCGVFAAVLRSYYVSLLVPVKQINNLTHLLQYAFHLCGAQHQAHLGLTYCVLYDFGLLAAQVVVFSNEVAESFLFNAFIHGKVMHSLVLHLENVTLQTAFKVHCSVSLCPLESFLVIVNLLLDEAVNEQSLLAHSGILDHGIENVLTLLLIVLVAWIEVADERKYVSYVHHVTVEQFKTEVDILNALVTVLNLLLAIVKHSVILLLRLDETHSHVEVL